MKTDLDKIKVARVRRIESDENNIPFLRRGIRRYKQLSTVYPQHKVISYFIGRLTFHLRSHAMAKLAKLIPIMRSTYISNIKNDVLDEGSIEKLIERVQRAIDDGKLTEKVTYSLRITGGLGDALIAARLARDIQAELGGQAEFDVYFHSPKIIEPFFQSIPGFRESIHIEVFESVVPYYRFSLITNQFVTFVNEHINHRMLLKNAPKILKLFGHVQNVRKPIDKYIAAHPALDGAFADLAVRQGHRRHTYLHEMLGLPYGGDLLNIPVDAELPGKFGLNSGCYITVHDGWDTKFKLLSARPMKALPLASWEKIVAEIKDTRPDIKIVQIGGKTGKDIPGVDINLKNRLDFLESASILAGSRLHIDTESGLVHLGASLGVRSVVIFGPTNVAWFGYPQNINITPKQCGNCWWSIDSWMDVCAVGHEIPVCTSEASIAPTEVAMHVINALDEPASTQRPVFEIKMDVSHAC